MDLHTLVVGRDAMACRFEACFNAGEVRDATLLGCAGLDLVEEIEARLSVYRDTSELARLNATAAADWQPASYEVFTLLERCRDLFHRTAGGFDVAAGALVRCWGFLERRGRTPAAAELAAALEVSGTRFLELDPATRRVRFARRGLEINPGAVGKGWALDRMAERFVEAGAASFLVHGGQSSVRARGVQGPDLPGRRGWPVGLRHPLFPGRRLATIRLVDRALGTSGSGTQFFIDRGRRLGHILDPRTGLPAEGVLSATVLAATAAEADALATALYVLGPAGLDLVAPPGGETAAILVVPAEVANDVTVMVANLPHDDLLMLDETAGLRVERRG